MDKLSEQRPVDYYTTSELETLAAATAGHVAKLQQIQQAAQLRYVEVAAARQRDMAAARSSEQFNQAQDTYEVECRKASLAATRCALIEHDRFANTRAAALLETEPDAPDADLETLWGEFYANLDASRDEDVPDPEDPLALR